MALAYHKDRRYTLTFAAVSLLIATLAGIVDFIAIPVFILLCLLITPVGDRYAKTGLGLLVMLSLLLATRQIPGVNNLLAIPEMQLSQNSTAFQVYWNYDKAFAGFAVFTWVIRNQPARAWSHGESIGFVLFGIAAIIMSSWLAGYIQWEPKWAQEIIPWMAANLLVTCLAEEAFFRGLLQKKFTQWLTGRVTYSHLVSIGSVACLFGVAHIAGGWLYVALATFAGLIYGLVYQYSGRLEYAIGAHFLVNLVHILLFTYPRAILG